MSQDDFTTKCLEELVQKSNSHQSAWQLGEEVSWSIDQKEQTIIFYFADGQKVSAPVQIIGTYDITEKTMLWAWANHSIQEDLSQNSQILRDFALKGNHNELLQEQSKMSEYQAWLYTALVTKMVNAFGAYRGQIKNSYIFMTFGSIFCSYEEGVKDPFNKKAWHLNHEGMQVQRNDLVNFVQSYFLKLFTLEQYFHQHQNKNAPKDYQGLIEQSLTQMNSVYDDFWLRDDDFHRPCSVSWPSDYDLSHTRQWQAYDLGEDIFRITFMSSHPVERRNSIYVNNAEETPKIIDFQYDSCDLVKDRPLT